MFVKYTPAYLCLRTCVLDLIAGSPTVLGLHDSSLQVWLLRPENLATPSVAPPCRDAPGRSARRRFPAGTVPAPEVCPRGELGSGVPGPSVLCARPGWVGGRQAERWINGLLSW